MIGQTKASQSTLEYSSSLELTTTSDDHVSSSIFTADISSVPNSYDTSQSTAAYSSSSLELTTSADDHGSSSTFTSDISSTTTSSDTSETSSAYPSSEMSSTADEYTSETPATNSRKKRQAQDVDSFRVKKPAYGPEGKYNLSQFSMYVLEVSNIV